MAAPILASAGTSAEALQVAGLRRGVDLLMARGATEIGVTGSSGGAVQAFYLGLSDPRVSAVVMASVPSIPRERRAQGCPCDQIPGSPGPDPKVLGALSVPALWLSELPQPRPAGLSKTTQFKVEPGQHGYDPAMQRDALDFFRAHLPLRRATWRDDVPHVDLRTPGAAADPKAPAIRDLPLRPHTAPGTTPRWTPKPDLDAPYELHCTGQGPVVLVAGLAPTDSDTTDSDMTNSDTQLAALHAVGFSTCVLTIPKDELALAEAIGSGQAAANRPAGAMVRAAARRHAVGIYALRAWGIPASATGLPFVVADP
ncbi:MAG: hypothetical protein GXP62_07360, partial [Oligoflexia bacterium]|nr:hypothetical protein [Oligoflexia bacterium]